LSIERRVTKFTIDRKKWLNGTVFRNEPDTASLMRNEKGQMCCLGFYGAACGLSARALTDKSDPSLVPGLPKEMHWLTQDDVPFGAVPSNACYDLMNANDTFAYDDEEREEEVARLFAKRGIEVLFAG
jgi:hypothetical protein